MDTRKLIQDEDRREVRPSVPSDTTIVHDSVVQTHLMGRTRSDSLALDAVPDREAVLGPPAAAAVGHRGIRIRHSQPHLGLSSSRLPLALGRVAAMRCPEDSGSEGAGDRSCGILQTLDGSVFACSGSDLLMSMTKPLSIAGGCWGFAAVISRNQRDRRASSDELGEKSRLSLVVRAG